MGLAPGFLFSGPRSQKQLAAIGEDGTVRILQRGQVHMNALAKKKSRSEPRLESSRQGTDAVLRLLPVAARKGEAWTTEREVVTGNVVGTNAASQTCWRTSCLFFRD